MASELYYVMDNILIMTPVQETKERQMMSQHFLLIGVQNLHCYTKQINVSNPQRLDYPAVMSDYYLQYECPTSSGRALKLYSFTELCTRWSD